MTEFIHMIKRREKKVENERCTYCKHFNKKCELDLIPIANDLCHDADCFLSVK